MSYGQTSAEKKSLQYRRSLYVVEDIKVGDVLTIENLRAIRPGLGLPPKYLHHVLGKKVNRNIPKGYAFSLDMLG